MFFLQRYWTEEDSSNELINIGTNCNEKRYTEDIKGIKSIYNKI